MFGLRRSSKALPKSQICTKIRSWSLFGDWCPFDPLQLSESLKNRYIWEAYSANWWNTLKTAMPAASIGQQRGPNYAPWQCSVARHHQRTLQKLNELGYEVFASTISHLFFCQLITTSWSILTTFFKENASTASKRQRMLSKALLVESWSTIFMLQKYIYFLLKKCFDYNGSYFDQ